MREDDGLVIGERIGIGRTAEVFAAGADRVVKVLRPGFPDRLGAAEAEAATLVSAAVASAPRFHGSTRVDGRYALVYERLPGESMLDRLSARPWQVAHLAREFAQLHVAMHAASGTGLPGSREALGWMIERAGQPLGTRAKAAALRRLAAMPDGAAICHGDMHPGNVLLAPTGPVVIDWLTAGCGPPAADVARTLFLLCDAAIPRDVSAIQRSAITLVRRVFARRYIDSYAKLGTLDRDAVALWRLPILAARLGEGIEDERGAILDMIDRELTSG